jgi:hypothetical protein
MAQKGLSSARPPPIAAHRPLRPRQRERGIADDPSALKGPGACRLVGADRQAAGAAHRRRWLPSVRERARRGKQAGRGHSNVAWLARGRTRARRRPRIDQADSG